MSVIGIGTDIVEVSRLISMSSAVRDKLAHRTLTPREYQTYQQHPHQIAFLAKRWAGKEAVAKAIGTGIAQGVSFQHIEIVSLENGKPTLLLTQHALQLAQQLGASHWHISLSDEKSYAIAFAVLSA
jgi:holo-[acyl-carrier protein] synthase